MKKKDALKVVLVRKMSQTIVSTCVAAELILEYDAQEVGRERLNNCAISYPESFCKDMGDCCFDIRQYI